MRMDINIFALFQVIFPHLLLCSPVKHIYKRIDIVPPAAAEFTSPGYEIGSYPNLATCTWDIVAAKTSSKLVIDFEEFEVEEHPQCVWDKVTIRSGTCNNPTNSNITSLCGNHSNYHFKSDDHSVCVSFYSDPIINMKGFKAIAKVLQENNFTDAIKGSTTPINEKGPSSTSTPDTLSTSTLSSILSSTIPSPSSTNVPSTKPLSQSTIISNKPQSLSTHYDDTAITTHSVDTTSTLKTSSQSFSTESKLSSIFKPQTTTISTTKTQTKASTTESSSTFKSPTTTKYSSASTSKMTSALKSPPIIALCEGNQMELNVQPGQDWIIRSPIDVSGNYPVNRHCTLNIYNPNALNVSISFTKFQLEYHPSCNWDYVKISTTTSQMKLCGAVIPAPIETDSAVLTIAFHSDIIISLKGFELLLMTKLGTHPGTTTTATEVTTDLPIEEHTDPKTTAILTSTTEPSLTKSVFTTKQSIDTSQITITPNPNNSSLTTLNDKESSQTTTDSVPDTTSTGKNIVKVYDICNTTQLFLTHPVSLVSPGFKNNQNYPKNKICNIQITSPASTVTEITIHSFDVEKQMSCSFDSLQIGHDGEFLKLCGTISQSELINGQSSCYSNSLIAYDINKASRICVADQAQPVEGTIQNNISLTFTSDVYKTAKGFNITLGIKNIDPLLSTIPSQLSSKSPNQDLAISVSKSTQITETTSSIVSTLSSTNPINVASSTSESNDNQHHVQTSTSIPAFLTNITTMDHTTVSGQTSSVPQQTSTKGTTGFGNTKMVTSMSSSPTSTLTPSTGTFLTSSSSVQTKSSSTMKSSSSISSSPKSTKLSSTGTYSTTSLPTSQSTTLFSKSSQTSTQNSDGGAMIEMCNISSLFIGERVTVVSPGFLTNKKYKTNIECILEVSTPHNTEIEIQLEYFDVEMNPKCLWDSMKIEYADQKMTICGKLSKESLRSYSSYGSCIIINSKQHCDFNSSSSIRLQSNNKATIRFISDHIVPATGFKIIIISKKIAENHDTSTIMTTSCPTISSNFNNTPSTSKQASLESTLNSLKTTNPKPSLPSTITSLYKSLPYVTTASSSESTPKLYYNLTTPSQSTNVHLTSSSLKPTTSETTNTAKLTQMTVTSFSPILTTKSTTIASKPTTTHITVETSTAPYPHACNTSGEPISLQGPSDYIVSPFFSINSTYSPNSNCKWKIKSEKNKFTMLMFEYFDLESSTNCRWDKLSIYEMVFPNSTLHLVASFCGSTLPNTLTSTNDMIIEFKSDAIIQNTGFKLKYIKMEISKSADSSKPIQSCPAAMTPCLSSDTCIPMEWMCDGDKDCVNGTDEINCQKCGKDEFSCGNGTCLPISLRCNGKEECIYGNDEHNCVTISNPSSGLVGSEIGGEIFPVCRNEHVINRQNDICKAIGYRASEAVWSAHSQHQTFASINTTVDDNNLQFSISDRCSNKEAVHLKCIGEGCGLKEDKFRRKRIIGGSVASSGEWPWSAALYIGTGFACGVSIIDDIWVLTAAHCVKDMASVPHVGYIIAGAHDLNDVNRQIRYVSEVVVHPDNQYIFYADIALLKLQRPLQFNSKVKPICLPYDKREFSPSSKCFIAGWGVSDMTNYYTTVTPKFLHHVKTKIVNFDKCKHVYNQKKYLNDSMICAGYTSGGMDACKGDSGGPLMCEYEDKRWAVAGVVSWGDMCGQTKKPGVYTKVTSFLDWIEKTVYPEEPAHVNCTFETSWCGYNDTSNDTYVWTRKPRGFTDPGSIMYAIRTGTEQNHPANATLISPSFNTASNGCASFSFMFSGNSNITLSVYGIHNNEHDIKEVLLWRITSNYPSKDSWKVTETDIPAGVTRLKFVSNQKHQGISGLGLDNITVFKRQCRESRSMNCNFNDGSLCMFSNANTNDWKLVDNGQGSTDYILQTGGDYNSFGYMSISQLVSPVLSSNFTSIPHCLHFSFNKYLNTATQLEIVTYIEVGGQLVNQVKFWGSIGSEIGVWTKVNVTIFNGYYQYIVFEVRRKSYTTDEIDYRIDDIRIVDGECV